MCPPRAWRRPSSCPCRRCRQPRCSGPLPRAGCLGCGWVWFEGFREGGGKGCASWVGATWLSKSRRAAHASHYRTTTHHAIQPAAAVGVPVSKALVARLQPLLRAAAAAGERHRWPGPHPLLSLMLANAPCVAPSALSQSRSTVLWHDGGGGAAAVDGRRGF